MIFLKIAEKHSTKSVIKTEVKLMTWLKIVHENKNGASCDENNIGSEVEVTSSSKDKEKKRVLNRMLL